MADTDILKQTGVGNDITQAGNDVYKDCTFISDCKAGGLAKKIDELRDNIKNDPAAGEFVEMLLDYMKRKDGSTVIGLEEKLKLAGRLDIYQDAEYLKSKFAKKLLKEELSISAQKAYAHILSYINTAFAAKVLPRIRNGEQFNAIDSSVMADIVEPVYGAVSTCSLEITTDTIRGMLYYLTGNCYIRWDK